MYLSSETPRLRVGTGWTTVTIQSEVGVVFTSRGYAPAIEVAREGFKHVLLVGARSLSEPIEKLRVEHGQLEGLVIELRKVRPEPSAPYEVRLAGG
jgi:hypothetical protein